MLSTVMVRLIIIMSVQFNLSILWIYNSSRLRGYVLYRWTSIGWISREG